ncbi:MAG TPA: hypothetical protein VM537_22035 [Anaerolineae bacterium]|nr:hypothetical protein [Anaerolineae bacterium]
MSLVINGVTVPILQGGHSKSNTPLTLEFGRAYGGVGLSGVTANRGHYRTWSYQTPRLLLADVQTIEALLDGPGLLTVSGVLAAGDAILCYALNVRRSVTHSLIWGALSFELTEDDPSYAEAGAMVLAGAEASLLVEYPGLAGAGTLAAITGAATASYGAGAFGAGTLAAITGAATVTYAAP